MHDVRIADIAVGKHDLVDTSLPTKGFQLRLVHDRDAVRIERACQRGGVAAPGNLRNLGCGKCHHAAARIIAIDPVEIVKVAARRSHDEYACRVFLVRHQWLLVAFCNNARYQDNAPRG
jgi:hypothetical protein